MKKKGMFWKEKTLAEMSPGEWEQLCDGCARCCVHKKQDEDTGEVFYTDIACRLLDMESCRCRCYGERRQRVPECVQLSADATDSFKWLPDTCAYRLLFEGLPLPSWHPLMSGNPNSTRDAGMSARNRLVSEAEVIERKKGKLHV